MQPYSHQKSQPLPNTSHTFGLPSNTKTMSNPFLHSRTVLHSTHNSTNMTQSSCTAWQSPTPRKTAWARNPLQISNNASPSNKVRSLAHILKVTNTTVCSQVPKTLFESDEEPEAVFQFCGWDFISRTRKMVRQQTVHSAVLQRGFFHLSLTKVR